MQVDPTPSPALDEPVAPPTQPPPLGRQWLLDQSLAFAATLLGTLEKFEGRNRASIDLLLANETVLRKGVLSDSTLAMIAGIDPKYCSRQVLEAYGFKTLPVKAEALSRLVAEAEDQRKQREAMDSDSLNRLLISHAVYLMRRRHLTAAKFLKWLLRAAPGATPGLRPVLAALDAPLSDGQTLRDRLDAALEVSRDAARPSHAPLQAIDDFHLLVWQAAGRLRDRVDGWLTRLCIAYRSSLFCWPLLTEDNSGTGLSLPIRFFVVQDGKSNFNPTVPDSGGQKVWFEYLSPSGPRSGAGKLRHRFAPKAEDLPAHIENMHFGFRTDWQRAFAVGLDAGKKLWSSQNGRLAQADLDMADAKRTASLRVDLHAACDIVEAVYGAVTMEEWKGIDAQDRFFTVYDRSAEAYWTQCTLARLLPSADLPMAICTGNVEYHRGEVKIGNVGGIRAKLTYANRIGVPRVVVPGDRRIYGKDSPEAVPDAVEELVEPSDRDHELAEFLKELESQGARKTLEVNFARTTRAAADAVQAAGWRRMSYLRTPGFRWFLGQTQRRLVVRDALDTPKDKAKLTKKDLEWYQRGNQWTFQDDAQMQAVDALLAPSNGGQVRHLGAHQQEKVRRILNGASVEDGLARWVAWKDAKIRSYEGGWRGPGLGVLTFRTAAGDNHLRLWAGLAEMLDATEGWWDRFRWSDREDAAGHLAKLLCNRAADPSISAASAPDLVILFDDAGLTMRRFNRVFASEFNHEFIDLLNPRATDQKYDHLEAALNRHGSGGALPLRLLIVQPAEPALETATKPESDFPELTEAEAVVLKRLAIFRFGFNEQAGFAMSNFQPWNGQAVGWSDYSGIVTNLCEKKFVIRQGTLHVTHAGRAALQQLSVGTEPEWVLAEMHRHAAHALCPILFPRGQVVAANRDRQLEPESVLEASWHLWQATSRLPTRFGSGRRVGQDQRPQAVDSRALLTYLRTAPDWDTVLQLRINTRTRADSLDLCQELFDQRRAVTGKPPTPRSIGLAIETLGNTFRHEPQVAGTEDERAEEVIALVETALAILAQDNPTPTERRRLQRYLFSRQLFALRMLGLSFNDPRLRGAKAYVDKAVDDILHEDFLDRIGPDRTGLDDFPISRECWRALWSDGGSVKAGGQSLTPDACARYAYAAARATLSRELPDQPRYEGWQEPWIAYFSLVRPDLITRAQIAAPLKTWWEVHSPTWAQALAFGTKVRNIGPHAKKSRKGKGPWKERWLDDINMACANLWAYVSASDPGQRLFGSAVQPALRLINVMAMKEDLPAFRLLIGAGPEWLRVWSDPASQGWHGAEWANLAKTVIGHRAGWAVMLAALADLPAVDDRLTMVRSWLAAFRAADFNRPYTSDPENLLKYATDLPAVIEFRATETRARYQAQALLVMRDDGQGALSEEDRTLLQQLMPAEFPT